MRLLITGSAGFIGSNLLRYLLNNTSYEIVVLVRMGRVGYLKRIEDIHSERFGIIHHDLRSAINEHVARDIGDVDVILHLAASTHVDVSITDPMSFVLDNVIGTTNLLEFARKHCKGTYLQFSTDEVFGPAPVTTVYNEWDRHNPNNPYAAAKSGAEMMVKGYANTYSLPCVITRGMNIFGPYQDKEKFIPMCIRNILLGETITVHADPTKTKAGTRFYIHTENISRGIEFILNSKIEIDYKNVPTYHFVGEKEVSNLEMVLAIAKIMGKEAKYEMTDFHSQRPGHDLRYGMKDNNLKALGWEIPQTFEASLKRTVEWYLENKSWLGL